jgi:lipid-A-disaccharide synthase
MGKTLRRLFCIFPFEEQFFRERGVNTTYIGHPLSRIVKPSLTRDEFLKKHRIPGNRPLVALCPGSRRGEIARHLPPLLEAVDRLNQRQALSFVLAAPLGFSARHGDAFFRERISSSPIKVVEGETWDVLAHADLTLAASGTVTIEAALLQAPVITFYRVTSLSWWLGRFLVKVPFYSMVNLVAGRRVAPELMQNEMSGERLACEAERLLADAEAREQMRRGLREVAEKLAAPEDPMEKAAVLVKEFYEQMG